VDVGAHRDTVAAVLRDIVDDVRACRGESRSPLVLAFEPPLDIDDDVEMMTIRGI
jgi:hypothetical protein